MISDIGLPANELAAALFSFNVGVELGQLLFIAVLLLLGWLALRLANRVIASSAQTDHSVLARMQDGMAGKTAVYAIGAFSPAGAIKQRMQGIKGSLNADCSSAE